MPEILTTEPTKVYAGDTVRWSRSLADYPASLGWVLVYTLINAAGKITMTSVANDAGDHFITAAAAVTATWSAGEYAWRAQAVRGDEAYTVGEGRMTVAPSFNSASLDTRSTARQALEAVQAYLADPQRIAAAEYQIAGRHLKRYSLQELWAHRDRLVAEVAREDAALRLAAGLPARRRVYVRFGR